MEFADRRISKNAKTIYGEVKFQFDGEYPFAVPSILLGVNTSVGC